jgi:hypothetical protein
MVLPCTGIEAMLEKSLPCKALNSRQERAGSFSLAAFFFFLSLYEMRQSQADCQPSENYLYSSGRRFAAEAAVKVARRYLHEGVWTIR